MKITKLLGMLILMSYTHFVHALPLIGSPYLGVEGGVAKTSSSENITNNTPTNLTAGRVFLGYHFLLFALEGGQDWLHHSEHARLKGYDMDAKLVLPLVCDLQLFATVGGSYLKQNTKYTHDDLAFVQDHEAHFLPLAGVGITYQFNSHVGLRLSWTHIMGHGDIRKTDFIPLGIVVSL